MKSRSYGSWIRLQCTAERSMDSLTKNPGKRTEDTAAMLLDQELPKASTHQWLSAK
jgi:hypothetical protein